MAVDDDYIRKNPTDKVLKEMKISHQFDSEKRKALTVEQQNLFLNYLRSQPKYEHWYPVFYIMANTGMRVGEITGLRWQDVDLKRKIVSVNHTLVYYNHRVKRDLFMINEKDRAEKERFRSDEVPAVPYGRTYQEEAEIKSVGRVDGFSVNSP